MPRVNGWYGHIKRNDLCSAAMLAGFLVAFQLIAIVALSLPLLQWDWDHAPFPNFLGYLTRYVPVVFAASGTLFLSNFLRHIASTRSTVGFGYVERRMNPRLFNIVETQAIAAGLPLPKVGLIESAACNAFACGLSARSAVVVVTRGLAEALDDDELAAVVAHEITHIKNGDIRLMAAANVLMDNVRWVQRQNPIRVEGYKQFILVIVLPPFLGLFLLAGFVTWVAMTLARVSRLLISSSREFVADAEAVRMTHNPAALISALRRIEGRSAIDGISPHAEAMMIDGATAGAFASHPTIAERVAVLTRLSGTMVHVSPLRKDTRPIEQIMAHRATAFGRKGVLPPDAEPADHGLIGRANAGSGDNPAGLTPALLVLLVVGFAGLQLCGGKSVESVLSYLRADAFRSLLTATSSNEGFINGESGTFRVVPRSAQQATLQRLAATDAVGARCFTTKDYDVGDRGLHRVNTADPALVQAFTYGTVAGQPDIKLERYLGYRKRTVIAVVRAGGGELDQALLSYVETRKTMLEAAHRFFGEPGLHLMRTAYDGSEDRAILDSIRRKLDDRVPAFVAGPPVAAELKLLVSFPGDFIPCIARAATAGDGT